MRLIKIWMAKGGGSVGGGNRPVEGIAVGQ